MCLKVKGQIEKSAVVCSCLLIDERVSVPAVEVRERTCNAALFRGSVTRHRFPLQRDSIPLRPSALDDL